MGPPQRCLQRCPQGHWGTDQTPALSPGASSPADPRRICSGEFRDLCLHWGLDLGFSLGIIVITLK